MKVLVCPHTMELGGSQLNAVQLARAVRDAGHEVVLVVPGSHPHEELLPSGVTRISVPAARIPCSGGYRLASARRVAGILTLTMMVLYFGFILLIAYAKTFLTTVIVPGLSLGILLGALVIVAAWVLILIYVRWANGRYDTAVAGLTAMIEPLLMVFLGGVVGGFLIAMYLPIFSIAGAVK